MNVKSNIRTSLLSRRLDLSSTELTKKSKFIQSTLINSVLFQRAKIIGCYLPIKNEVITNNLIECAINGSKIIAVPKVKEDMMVFQDFSPTDQLRKNKFGILENKGRVVRPNEFDLIICPALAVDLNGNRIGYGQGYYDRYLLKASNAKFIALIFDFQLLDERVIAEPHDVSMHYLCNENELTQTK